MVTDEKIEPNVIDKLRAIRDRINLEIQDMNKEELLEFLNNQKTYLLRDIKSILLQKTS